MLFCNLFDKVYSQTLIDSRGKDFWFTFIPNYHDSPNAKDSIIIYIAADKATSGTIEFQDRFGSQYSKSFDIKKDNEIFTFGLNSTDFELLGFNEYGNINNFANDNETISPLHFHITSNDNISVFCLQSAQNTNDAFLSLPTHALANQYIVMSFNSDGRQQNNNISDQSTPSQFAILATEDNTNIEIIPTKETFKNKLKTQNITLMKGETYLVQANITFNALNNDLTGSRINANKPIAVFSGHQRTQLPLGGTGNGPSRDMLVEQLFPVKSWGRNAFLIPFAPPLNQIPEGEDIYRIVAAYDKTKIDTNGVYYTTLKSGQMIEGNLKRVLHVEATKPIMVAAFKKTANRKQPSTNDGDPFMMLIPPKEQFSKVYLTLNMQSYSTDSKNVGDVRDQYMTAIVPNASIDKVYLDGQLLDPKIFISMGQSGYSYSILKVLSGTHTLKSDTEIGIYIYGYGPVNSYGYIGGMSAKNNDYHPPVLLAKSLDCSKSQVILTDTAQFDSGIISVKLNANSINTDLQIPTITKDEDVVFMEAKCINPYMDASFSITVKDSFGLEEDMSFMIPGFTISPFGSNVGTAVIPKFIDTIKVGKNSCFDLKLENYGAFSQTFDILHNADKELAISPQITKDAIINTKLKGTYNYCFKSDSNGTFFDTIFVWNGCVKRVVALVQITTYSDRKVPTITEANPLKCDKNYMIQVSDNQMYDSGIEKIAINDTNNIELYINFQNLNKNVSINYNVKDPYQDAFINLDIIDSSNNVKNYQKYINGFTASFTLPEINFAKVKMTGQYCDTIQIANYGKIPMYFDELTLAQNTLFSIPQTQLPFTIQAGDTANIFVCFSSNTITNKEDIDTLFLKYNCNVRAIKLRGKVEEYNSNTLSRCGLKVNFKAKSTIGTSSLSYSNANNQSNLVVETENDIENAKLYIYSDIGKLVYSTDNLNLTSGEYQFEINSLDLANGVYFAIFENSIINLNEKFIISK